MNESMYGAGMIQGQPSGLRTEVLKVDHLCSKPGVATWPLCDSGPYISNQKSGETVPITQSCCEN